MEKIIAFSIAGFTLLTSKATDLLKVALACMILSFIASFQDFCTFFSLLLRLILFLFSLPQYCFSSRRNKAIADGVECRENNDDELFVVDGLINTSVCLEEVSHLFDENEPSFEEIKETFGMFDEDGDGYIDEKDLGKLLFRMGFCEFSQRDCRGMIKAFDENKDGRIDIGEFLKLMEDSFD